MPPADQDNLPTPPAGVPILDAFRCSNCGHVNRIAKPAERRIGLIKKPDPEPQDLPTQPFPDPDAETRRMPPEPKA